MVGDRGWGPWLGTVVGDRGWGPWLGTVVGDRGWGPWLGTRERYHVLDINENLLLLLLLHFNLSDIPSCSINAHNLDLFITTFVQCHAPTIARCGEQALFCFLFCVTVILLTMHHRPYMYTSILSM